MAEHNELGALGERVVEKFLTKRGFIILDRNYRRPWGELDIVAKDKGILHFVEVKSVSGFSQGSKDGYRPEDNLHRDKIARLKRIIQTYLMDKRVSDETIWRFDLATVFIDGVKRSARVKFIKDIVLD